MSHNLSEIHHQADFYSRHIGITNADEKLMLNAIGAASLQALIDDIVPTSIASQQDMDLPAPITEEQALDELRTIAAKNSIYKSFIGQGYYDSLLPKVILRNVLENPAWYTAYTPYQAEISQGRLEALINFQTMVCDLTGMEIANASMLDEATAAAEAMTLARRSVKSRSNVFIISNTCHPQTIEVIKTRAKPLGLEILICESDSTWLTALEQPHFAAIAQYPASTGAVLDFRAAADKCHAQEAALILAADLLSLTLLQSPAELHADIAVGSTQRFGLPMGAGGPHAGYLACQDSLKRSLPGRLVGLSVDTHGAPAYRLALQTREQHIRREKATSNICTAQVLPAIIASMYAVYHGPKGLKQIAKRISLLTALLAKGLKHLEFTLDADSAFDTLSVKTGDRTKEIAANAVAAGCNLRLIDNQKLGISLDETSTIAEVKLLWEIFAKNGQTLPNPSSLQQGLVNLIPTQLHRQSEYLTHPVFNNHHSETAMLRYLRKLSDKDLALDRCMISLGSCTMKLNATSELIPITWPEFGQIHPFAPAAQLQGYAELDKQLRAWLSAITGYADVSLQPNAGSQGEYAGLLAIRAYHQSRDDEKRDICLIPASAHGTNPASAQMVGLRVIVVRCDKQGNVDLDDLRTQCEKHHEQLACIMITYPSTHGVFETQIKDICSIVRKHGGRIYIDGANMNAMVGLAQPGQFGGDVSHLNLHKTFCIPHGGGGPGVGPVCVAQDLIPFLPGNTSIEDGGVGAISAAKYGNAGVLPISWMYSRMMGHAGLKQASQIAILNANYISTRLQEHYPTLYAGTTPSGQRRVGHECILDLRPIKDACGISAEDVAKRLIDYGFHAPTLSFPVPGTLMVEPTESEPYAEIDRFIDAMIAIRAEIRQVENGSWPADNNPLINAPHTATSLLAETWTKPYSREVAAYPNEALKETKYWCPVGRIDNVYGDRNLFCSCIPLSDYQETTPNETDRLV